MVTANILQRVFLVKYGNATGTCFTLEVDGRQYIITAAHVVEGIQRQDTINLQYKNTWKNLSTTLVWSGAPDSDIAVLAIPFQLSHDLPVTPTTNGIFLSQDVFFLGFPYGLFTDIKEAGNGWPIPFVKKGIVSAFRHSEKKVTDLYIDGHNNSGFSGGPVVFSDPGSRDIKVAGVISGYESTQEPIYDAGITTELRWLYNTGIIIVYDIAHAVEGIRTNPIGFQLGSQ